jgi:formylmethanofuran dehydrogenase subunit B
MPAAPEERLRRNVACPFCGLACDDLTIARSADRLEVAEAGCWLSRRRYAELQSAPDASPIVDGHAAALDAVIERAAEILASSRGPAFAVAADVAGTRAVLRLADRLGGVVDHPGSDALFHNLRILQDAGALTTTLSEVRNRADFVLVVGPDPVAAFPRFYERCIDPPRTLFAEGTPARALLRLGPPAPPNGSAPVQDAPGAADRLFDELPCDLDRMPAALAALRALISDRPVAPLDVPGLDLARLADLAARMKAARYALVAWAPAMFEESGAQLVALGLLEVARAVTRTTRCSVLALGGSANLFGVNQVCTWQTGYPLRTSLANGVPQHDPWRYSARRMYAAGECDALVWISAFDASFPVPAGSAPVIVLAPPHAAPPGRVQAYIPVGVPGVDHEGQIFRSDGVVALPLRASIDRGLSDVASLVGRIEASLAARAAVAP